MVPRCRLRRSCPSPCRNWPVGNAVELTHARFGSDVQRLESALRSVLDQKTHNDGIGHVASVSPTDSAQRSSDLVLDASRVWKPKAIVFGRPFLVSSIAIVLIVSISWFFVSRRPNNSREVGTQYANNKVIGTPAGSGARTFNECRESCVRDASCAAVSYKRLSSECYWFSSQRGLTIQFDSGSDAWLRN